MRARKGTRYARATGENDVFHGTGDADMGWTHERAPLVRYLRRASRAGAAPDNARDAIPDRHRSCTRSRAEPSAHDQGAIAPAIGARTQVTLAWRGGIQRDHRGVERRSLRVALWRKRIDDRFRGR